MAAEIWNHSQNWGKYSWEPKPVVNTSIQLTELRIAAFHFTQYLIKVFKHFANWEIANVHSVNGIHLSHSYTLILHSNSDSKILCSGEGKTDDLGHGGIQYLFACWNFKITYNYRRNVTLRWPILTMMWIVLLLESMLLSFGSIDIFPVPVDHFNVSTSKEVLNLLLPWDVNEAFSP